SIIAVTAAFGMKNTDVDITNQSISLNWAPEGKIPYSRVRVVRSWSSNFQALSAVHRLVTDITAGRLTRGEAEAQLDEITRQPKPYPRWIVTLCGALFASFFASFLGAPILDALAGFAATILVIWVVRQLTAWRVPEFFTLAAGGFIVSAFAMIAFGLDANITPSMVTAGGLMILLPSVRIVGAIQDAINGFPITAAGRLVSVTIAFAGMTSGIMAAVVGSEMVGIYQTELAQGLTRIYPAPVLILLVFLACCAAAIVEQTRPLLILPTGVVGALGFCALYLGELIGLGDRFTPVIGGLIVGALGRVVALRLGAPQLVVAVPAMMFMLPGLMIFRGMYQLAIDNTVASMMGGLFELFNALIIIMAIAAGIVLGDVVMRPLTAELQSNERSRARRR
ncbi:threonine/serine exporter family protein, partial [Nesterenkonia alkaliphila]